MMVSSQYPERGSPKQLIVSTAIIVVILVATYGILTWRKPTFTVYTYDSFLLWGDDPDNIDDTVFGAFEAQFGIDLSIVRLQADANGIISRLIAESENPVADVVIGIDNILILQNLAKSVLEPYTPTNLDLINDSIVNALDSEHYVSPFDFGLVTVIYKPSVVNTTSHPTLENLTLENLANLSHMLVTENPHFSSPGLSFLLSQIAIYEKLLHEDWTDWWSEIKDDVDVQEGWTEAWTRWDSDPTRHLLVSYGTDPAYSSFFIQGAPDTAIAPLSHDGVNYAWMQVEGMGLVKGGPNPDLAKAFIDYCLSASVQSHVALNQWMFPANVDVEFDPAFEYALHPNDVSLLNALLPSSEIAANLNSWLDDYDEIMTGL